MPSASRHPTASAVFLDRDGTLIRDQHHAFRPEAIEVLDGVIPGLRLLQAAGFHLFVITNQGGVARGYFTEQDVLAMHARLDAILRAADIAIAGYYYCPHHPEGTVDGYSIACDCRKPRPGLILRAAEEAGLDPRRAWMIGDAPTDALAGRAAGCQTILLSADPAAEVPVPTRRARSFLEAATIVWAREPARFAPGLR